MINIIINSCINVIRPVINLGLFLSIFIINTPLYKDMKCRWRGFGKSILWSLTQVKSYIIFCCCILLFIELKIKMQCLKLNENISIRVGGVV